MARPVQKKRARRKRGDEQSLPLNKVNYGLLLIGLAVILIGYAFMLEGSVDGVMPIVISPILLVIGYCIIIPIALLYRQRNRTEQQSEHVAQG